MREIEGRDMEEELAKAEAILKATHGRRRRSRSSTRRRRSTLLEPWLGSIGGLDDLPVPRLITVAIDPDNPPDFAALEKTLAR